MFLFLLMFTFTSLCYAFSSHPVLLTVLILTQALLTCGLGWNILNFSWLSFILFLIFLGGLMVLFIYIVSLASNELSSLPSVSTMIILSFVSLMVSSTIVLIQPPIKEMSLLEDSLMNLYSSPIALLTAFSMVYLLFVLIVVVKATSNFNAPIKNFIFK